MKIIFEDKSYIECAKSHNSDAIHITISAKDIENPLKKINNSVELSMEEFKKLFSDILK